MAMCGADGARPPRCRISAPLSKRGAASSSPDTNWEEAEASRVTAPPGSDPLPCTVNGMAPRPPSSMTAPSSRSAARIWPHRPLRRPGVAVEVHADAGQRRDGWHEAQDRAGVADIHAGAGVWLPRGHLPGRGRASRAWIVLSVVGDRGAEGGQRRAHQQRVAGVQRAGDGPGPVGEGGEHQGPVGHGLGAGNGQARAYRARRAQGPPSARPAGRLCCAVCSIHG